MFRLALVTVFTALAAFAQVADPSTSINELVRSNPAAALRQMAAERPQLFQGSLRSLTFDNPATGELETRTTLQIGEESYPVYSEGQTPTGCMESANVRGYRVGGQILAASIENAGPLNSPACSSLGEQKTLVLLVQTQALPLPVALTKAFVESFMSVGAPPTVDGYFREVSDGQAWVTPTVAGPFTMAPSAYGCADVLDPGTLQPTLLLAAMAATGGSVDFTQYSRIILIGPAATATPACSTRVYSNSCVNLTAPGNIPLVASWGYISSSILPTSSNGGGVNLASKVIANGMGVGWTYTRNLGTETIGPMGPGAPPPSSVDVLNGDHSIMGSTQSYGGVYPLGHISAEQKVVLGWHGSSEFLNVQTTSVNTLLPTSSSAVGAKALRIRRGSGYNEWLWVEHRQLSGAYESTLTNYAPTLSSGVLIHQERPSDTRKDSYLLHFNPLLAPKNFNKAMLVPGTTWNDPYSNLTLQVAAANPGPGMVVTATYRATGGCTYPLSPALFAVSNAAGTGAIAIGTGPYCEWSAISNSPFVTVTTSPTFGTGPKNVTFSYAANGTGSARTGTIDVGIPTILTNTATVNQSAGSLAGNLQISGKTTLSGAALAGVTIALSGSATQTATTNATGDYVLGGWGAGSYTVTPTLVGHTFTPANTTFSSMASNQTANFAATNVPATMSLDRTRLNYTARSATVLTPLQRVLLSFGGGTAAWTASSNQPWLQVTPASGTGPTRLTISLVPGSLPGLGAASATVTISAPTATNPTLTLPVFLTVLASSGAPYGSFDTPANGKVFSSIPVTGWAMDDVHVTKVEIFRNPIGGENPPGGRTYIGDALFVANARPDVENQNLTRPFQYRAGWGYQMLTNTIPNANGPVGNGTITITAIATDVEGNTTNLGSKTIILDNANAKLPFGAIDYPGSGATVSGTSFLNNGWVLTPQPNIISAVPTNITVYVDSGPLGRVTYGQFRSDIGGIFPQYRNANGAGASYILDTTRFSNGIHTIEWLAYDDAGNADGIGSRYFFIENGVSGGVIGQPPPVAMELLESTTARSARPRPRRGAVPQVMNVQEMARLVIELPEGQWTGAHVINDEMRPLPVGSTLDNASGAFYWNLGTGFLGQHELLFTSSDGAVHGVTLNIGPKTYGEKQ